MRTTLAHNILLVKVQKQGDKEAFEVLYKEFAQPIFRFVMLKMPSREEAEDLVSELFLRSWQHLTNPKSQPIKNFRAFIYQSARNAIADAYRARRLLSFSELESDVSLLPGQDRVVDKVADKLELEQLFLNLKKLKQEYQDVIFLRHVEGYEIVEIAEIMEKSRVAVRVILHRATKKLEEITLNNLNIGKPGQNTKTDSKV